MALPKIVQRQLEAAEDRLRQANASPEPQATETTPEPTPAPAPEPAPAAEHAAPERTDDWEHKFRSMQGKYNADVPALRAENKVLTGKMVALEEQVRALAKAAQAKPAEPPPAPDPRDVQQFGEDMIEMVHRQANQVFKALEAQFSGSVSQFEKRIAALEEQVSGVSQKTERSLEDTFYAALDTQVSDWRQINQDPRWLEWLGEIDPVYGAPRQAALDNAHSRFDAARTVAIFKQFKAQAKKPDTLHKQVAPGPSAAAPAPTATPSKPMLSAKDITKFYDDLAKGRYRGREQAAAEREREIDSAVAEGRVVA